MRRGGPQDETGDAAGALEQLPMDSLLLPWDAVAKCPVDRQGLCASDVLHVSDDYRAGSGGLDDSGKDGARGRGIVAAAGAPFACREPPHASPDGALARQQEAPQQESPQGRRVLRGHVNEAGKVAEASHLVPEWREEATKPRSRGLDVHGAASSKAQLAPEAYSQRRGRGKPPPNSGAAPVGQAFLERGPARPLPFAKGPGTQAKPPGGWQAPSARSWSAGGRRSGAAVRKSQGDAGTWNPIASDKWYENKDATFGRALRAVRQAGSSSHPPPAAPRPLLPATQYAGITLPVHMRTIMRSASGWASRGVSDC